MEQQLKNIKLDLLLRIDFFALTNFGKDENIDDEKFEKEKNALKKHYGFSHYFQREFQGYEYIRFSDLEKEIQPYIEYLISLDNKEIFDCCHLEQVIGVFQNEELKAFIATDTGICYNSNAHFASLAELFINGESNLDHINTFYGKIVGDSIELLYTPKYYNIDLSKKDDTIRMLINRNDFELEFKKLKKRVNIFFSVIKSKLKSEKIKLETKYFVDEVFNEIK